MTSPEHRSDPPVAADEITTLRSFLDYHRETLRWKTSGLTREQLAQTHPPSTMTLIGMLKHLAFVEDWWFNIVLTGNPAGEPFADVDWSADPDWDWHSAVDDAPEDVLALWEGYVARSDRLVDAAPDGLDTVSARPSSRTGNLFTLRWILVHMIEEYARHNGHADLIREAIDGAVGE
ncbi:DinB family protein [Aeromicrobium sp. CTD01-1L150]|uniref:DinB family protein n=1 Tax=Aeromicrobium sp. CTD01-1L150 TaxID=3341830 RepID=UPI0035C25F52